MAYTQAHLDALEAALVKGEKRVTFGDKTVEYRSVDELQAAIRGGQARPLRAGRGHRTVARRATPDPGHHRQRVLNMQWFDRRSARRHESAWRHPVL
jgi:hypothetical protein